jgi:hypothetical protein
MPYISKERRAVLDARIVAPLEPGDLNYVITRIVQQFLAANGGPNYARFNAAIGALECAKLELYRRQIAPYETLKALENGDVY